MAKIIKCPNCGENVEIPPNAAGQMVTCIACGTTLRLKSRKKDHHDSSTGSLSGSMTTIAQGYGHPSSGGGDDPPSLGTECEVCGQSVDPEDLLEDRGRMVCRKCLKKPKTSGKPAKFDNLIPFAEPEKPVMTGQLITLGPAFIGGCAALALFVACQAFLFFNPKPVGSKTVATNVKADPGPTSETPWDRENKPIIEKMLAEAAALKADPAKAKEAMEKYLAIVEHAKGKPSGSKDVTALVNQAEREAEALRPLVASAAVTTTAPAVAPADAGTVPPAPPEAVAINTTPTPPTPAPAETVVAPEDQAPKDGTVFEDPDATITDKLGKGMTELEQALGQPGDPAVAKGEEAIRLFSEARYVLARQNRASKDDPAWNLANHGTAVGYVFTRKYSLAIEYLNRLAAPPDRAATINRCVALMQLREEKLGTIKLLLGLLANDSESPDLYTANLLGTALGRYPDEAFETEKELRDAKTAYNAVVKKLQATHPGERRWGVTWITPKEHDAKLRESARQKNQLKELEMLLARARADQTKFARNPQMVAQRQTDEQEALRRIADLRSKMVVEEWLTPEQLLPVLPDLTAVNDDAARAATQPATAPAAPQ